MGTKYIVEIDLKTSGGLEQGVKKASTATDKLSQSVERVSAGVGSIGGKMMGVADKVAQTAFHWGKIAMVGGAVTAVGALTYAVGSLNNKLEQTQISLGAIFNAQGITAGLPAGLSLASDVIERMRRDAALLPGEFSDLINIFTTASIPGFQAGATVEQFQGLSAKAMAAGVVASMPLDQVAREFAMLLQGRSGAHNVFGMRLLGLSGDAAEKFNKMDPSKRLALISTELDKYGEALDYFGTSFEGQFSTMLDNAKNLLRIGTEPIFGKTKNVLAEINKYLSSSDAEQWAQTLGTRLVNAFDWGRQKIEEWWPIVVTFGNNAYDKIASIWQKVQPYVDSFGASLKEALAAPESLDKVESILKLYIAAKGVQAVGGPLLQIGSGALNAAGALKLIGGGGAAAGAAAGAAGTAGAGAAAATGIGGMTATVGGLTVVGGAALGAVALGAVAAFSGVAAAVNEYSLLQDEINAQANANKYAIRDWAERTVEAAMKQKDGAQQVYEAMARFRDSGDTAKASALGLALSMDEAAHSITRSAEYLDQQARTAAARAKAEAGDVQGAAVELGIVKPGMTYEQRMAAQRNAQAQRRATAKALRDKFKIQKVEIVVTTNQNPSRFARELFDIVGNMADQKRRTYSQNVTNYALRRT